MREQLERAYALGDHRTARALARRVLAAGGASELEVRAREILMHTRPDPFLSVVGALGLGLVGWLVYNYLL